MNYLVGNGTRLYRRDRSLVRNPIYKTITLAPDERAYYAVAGTYSNAWPTTGFLGASPHWTQVVPTGKRMRRAFLSPQQQQMWRKVTTAHDPEFVFYQGAYSTATNTQIPEAFMQLCAYHFTIPAAYAGWGVSSAVLTLTHGATIMAWGNAKSNTGGNVFVSNFNETDYGYEAGKLDEWKHDAWLQRFGVFDALTDPTTMLRQATDVIALETNVMSGKPTGNRDLWGAGNDGYIPTTTTPFAQNINLPTLMTNALQSKRGGWIAGVPPVSVSTSDDTDTLAGDYPTFSNSSLNSMANAWLCCSYWGFSLRLTLEL